ncbi:MAG: FAD-dependent oxidoreductase [Actinomycetia bacterium]|nr:FAD-dependent oxidoreductase [Actinomycetes bacterium]
MTQDLPARAHVVIIGGGIVGASVAYHLAELGWTDVVLIEQGRLSGGTTWHAAGLVGQLRATESGTRLVQYSAALYERLEHETGLGTGIKRCGGVTVARTRDRMVQLQRTAATAEAYDLECELITPNRAKELYPLLAIDDLVGGIWLPGDCTANPTDVTQSLAKGARSRGVRIVEGVRATGLVVQHGSVAGVETDHGLIETDVVVNCAGQWANAVAAQAGVTVPLHSAEHFYVVTEQIDGVHRDLPILRDPDGYTYMKEEVGGLVVGGFEPEAKPWVGPDQIPHPFEFQLLGEDWEHFEILMENALLRIPALRETGIKKFYNGPESFTPDNQFILGEAPELRNYFVGAGFNSVGIASAGGAGKALAEWVVHGEPTTDLTSVDIRRFASFNGNRQWLHDRVAEVLGLHYAIPWPNRELSTARPFRRSPVHHLLEAQGAVFGSKMGWERANVFAPTGSEPSLQYTWGKPDWVAWSAIEQRAARQSVALFDQSSFGKMLVTGSDVLPLLQRVCTADVAVDVGRAVYTGMLNNRGGYEADVTVTRIAEDEYLIVTGAASIVRDIDWIRRHIASTEQVNVVDVTAMFAVFAVMGPMSRELLQSLSRADLSAEHFPFATSREIDIGQATVRATRITYVGELGWELYVPVEFAVDVYDLLVSAGAAFGLVPAGYYSINSLRLEKGYRAFGADLTPDYTPLDAGLVFACKLATDIDFIGRAALEEAKKAGARRRLVSIIIEDPEVMMWGGELVLRDGQAVGQVTSAAWGETIGSSVALAYVRRRDGGTVDAAYLDDGRYEVNVGGVIWGASAHRRAPYDPDGARTRN